MKTQFNYSIDHDLRKLFIMEAVRRDVKPAQAVEEALKMWLGGVTEQVKNPTPVVEEATNTTQKDYSRMTISQLLADEKEEFEREQRGRRS